MRTLTVLVLVTAMADVASAAITMQVIEVDNSFGGTAMDGYVTQDIVVTTDTDWLGAQMIVQPDAVGLIYQDDYGNANPQAPNPNIFCGLAPSALCILSPSLAFDTYVSNGVLGETANCTGAVDLGGPASAIFTEDELSIAWYTDATDDIVALILARVTLQDTTTGTWSFLATAAPAEGPRVDVPAGVIENGVMYIPEPATLSLLGVVSLVLCNS